MLSDLVHRASQTCSRLMQFLIEYSLQSTPLSMTDIKSEIDMQLRANSLTKVFTANALHAIIEHRQDITLSDNVCCTQNQNRCDQAGFDSRPTVTCTKHNISSVDITPNSTSVLTSGTVHHFLHRLHKLRTQSCHILCETRSNL